MQRHPKAGARVRGLVGRKGARGALAVGASLAGAALTMGTFAMPAGAALTPPANSTIIGSGSSTTYNMMISMDALFNTAPGCETFIPFPSTTNPQPLDFSCTGPQQSTESGVAGAIPENPYNDISVQEAPLGSSNGIAQLEDQGTHGTAAAVNVADNIAYARSSRAFNPTTGSSNGDNKGLNFVAYAADGVPWFHYTSVNAAATPSAAIATLTQAQLQGIYNGTISNWNQVGGTKAPIVVFSAQEGSGTQSTFKGFLGFDPSAAANPVNCYTPKGGTKTCVGPAVIFENEDAQIQPAAFTSSQAGFVNNNPQWGATGMATPAGIKKDAVFFFSAGKYALSCKHPANCGGSPLKGSKNAIGEINGIAATQATILQGTFPVDRFLYNVYSNGSNSANIPSATAATLNYVSEVGFICNPNKGASTPAVDPLTGTNYINEIQSVIENNGFYPLSAGRTSGTVNQTEIDEGSVDTPATTLLNSASGGTGGGLYGYPQYKGFDTDTLSGGDPTGFCLVFTTDGNSTP
jgi:ABC-type phosphate transport system substrate-binding protein